MKLFRLAVLMFLLFVPLYCFAMDQTKAVFIIDKYTVCHQDQETNITECHAPSDWELMHRKDEQ